MLAKYDDDEEDSDTKLDLDDARQVITQNTRLPASMVQAVCM